MDRWCAEEVCNDRNESLINDYGQTVRKVMYTTNAIESVNSGFRRLNRGRTVFPNAANLLKALYLAT